MTSSDIKSKDSEDSNNRSKEENFLHLTPDQVTEIELAKLQIEKNHSISLNDLDERVKLWLK